MMSRQPKSIFLPLVGTILLCMLVGVYLAAWKRYSKQSPSTRIVKHTVETPPEDAIKYWTADKMRAARPVKLPNVTNLRRKKQQPQPPNTPNSPDA